MPLSPQATTTMENRREAGTQVQVDIFGEGMWDFWKSGPEKSRRNFIREMWWIFRRK